MVVKPVTGIYSRIESEAALVPCVLQNNEASRQGEVFEQNIVLQVETDVRAVEAVLISVGIVSAALRVVERFAEVAADDVLVAVVGAECRSS